MKVLFTFGGMPHYLVSLLNKLSIEYNIDVIVVRPANKGITIGKGVKLTDDGAKFRTILSDEYNSLIGKPYFKGFYTILKSEQPDIIVLGWPYIVNFSFDLKSLLYVKKNKIGVILREVPFQVAPNNQPFSFYKNNPIIDEDNNNITPKGIIYYAWAFILWIVRNWYYRSIDATIAYADLAYEIEQSYGIKKEAIFVSYNSIDTDELFTLKKEIINKPLLVPYNPYRLIHIGRLVKWKRVDLIIQVIPLLKQQFPNTELIIIGTGPEEDILKKMAEDLNISNSVKFLGSIYGYEKIGQHLLSSGIYVLAGMGGLSINEAMSFGKPVVCSVCDGTEKALVKNEYNGFFFENGNADSLYQKIEYLFKNPYLMETMGKNSENIILNGININTVAGTINKAFYYVLNKKK
jgi:glycosyltransferase involved in cell wall biosynthesis